MGHIISSDVENMYMGDDESPINMTAILKWRDEGMLVG